MPAGRGGGGDDEREGRRLLDRTLGGVRRLEGRRTVSPGSGAKPRPRARSAAETPQAGEREAAFEVIASGERIEGLAAGVDRAHLRRLRSGEMTVERRVDLHGLSARAASGEVRRAILAAFESGERCVLVVHGRGTHSPEGPVLKAFLLKWLTGATLEKIVMAFASARPRDGGAGATYVLLRRKR